MALQYILHFVVSSEWKSCFLHLKIHTDWAPGGGYGVPLPWAST